MEPTRNRMEPLPAGDPKTRTAEQGKSLNDLESIQGVPNDPLGAELNPDGRLGGRELAGREQAARARADRLWQRAAEPLNAQNARPSEQGRRRPASDVVPQETPNQIDPDQFTSEPNFYAHAPSGLESQRQRDDGNRDSLDEDLASTAAEQGQQDRTSFWLIILLAVILIAAITVIFYLPAGVP